MNAAAQPNAISPLSWRPSFCWTSPELASHGLGDVIRGVLLDEVICVGECV
jgi:hypothetical protein